MRHNLILALSLTALVLQACEWDSSKAKKSSSASDSAKVAKPTDGNNKSGRGVRGAGALSKQIPQADSGGVKPGSVSAPSSQDAVNPDTLHTDNKNEGKSATVSPSSSTKPVTPLANKATLPPMQMVKSPITAYPAEKSEIAAPPAKAEVKPQPKTPVQPVAKPQPKVEATPEEKQETQEESQEASHEFQPRDLVGKWLKKKTQDWEPEITLEVSDKGIVELRTIRNIQAKTPCHFHITDKIMGLAKPPPEFLETLAKYFKETFDEVRPEPQGLVKLEMTNIELIPWAENHATCQEFVNIKANQLKDPKQDRADMFLAIHAKSKDEFIEVWTGATYERQK